MNAKVRPEGEQRSAGQDAPRAGAVHGGGMGAPRLSRRAESLGTENAFVVLAEVNALQREGKDIVSFCIGQPDFPTPPNVQDAAIAAIRGIQLGGDTCISCGIEDAMVQLDRDESTDRLDLDLDDQ